MTDSLGEIRRWMRGWAADAVREMERDNRERLREEREIRRAERCTAGGDEAAGVLDAVARRTGISVTEILGRSKLPPIATARIEAMIELARRGWKQSRIAGLFDVCQTAVSMNLTRHGASVSHKRGHVGRPGEKERAAFRRAALQVARENKMDIEQILHEKSHPAAAARRELIGRLCEKEHWPNVWVADAMNITPGHVSNALSWYRKRNSA